MNIHFFNFQIKFIKLLRCFSATDVPVKKLSQMLKDKISNSGVNIGTLIVLQTFEKNKHLVPEIEGNKIKDVEMLEKYLRFHSDNEIENMGKDAILTPCFGMTYQQH